MARVWPGSTTTDYLALPSSAVWGFTTNICLMAILRWTSAGTNPGLLGLIESTVTRGYNWYIRLDGRISTFNAGSLDADGTATTALSNNTWHAIMVAWSSGGNRQFKRYTYGTGVLATETVTSAASTTALLASDSGLYIGQDFTLAAGSSWNNTIERVLVGQGTPVTDEQFINWAKYGRIPDYVVPKGYWILGGASPELDLSGNGLNATVTGTTVLQVIRQEESILARDYDEVPA